MEQPRALVQGDRGWCAVALLGLVLAVLGLPLAALGGPVLGLVPAALVLVGLGPRLVRGPGLTAAGAVALVLAAAAALVPLTVYVVDPLLLAPSSS